MPGRTARGLDAAGFILPEVALDRLTPPYAPVVTALRERCRAAFGATLHSLYLCGSVVKGTARPRASDLDALAALWAAPTATDEALARDVTHGVEVGFPFVAGASLGLYHWGDIASVAERYDMGFFVKCLCVCIAGDDLAAQLPRYRPSVALARGTNGNFRHLLDDRRRRLAEAVEPAVVAFLCRGIMRKIIHTGFTLVMPRYQGWTSDLEQSVAIFATYYPAQQAAMATALTLARTPITDKGIVLTLLDTLGTWLADEYDRVIMSAA